MGEYRFPEHTLNFTQKEDGFYAKWKLWNDIKATAGTRHL
jgi:hypothetical protein